MSFFIGKTNEKKANEENIYQKNWFFFIYFKLNVYENDLKLKKSLFIEIKLEKNVASKKQKNKNEIKIKDQMFK